MRTVQRVEARLSQATAEAYRRCIPSDLHSIEELKDSTGTYLTSLQARAAEAEFLDLAKATQVADGCLALLRTLRKSPDPVHHRAVQAAVVYFILEDDAESDDSIVGFDDDYEVVRVTAEVLGWDLAGLAE